MKTFFHFRYMSYKSMSKYLKSYPNVQNNSFSSTYSCQMPILYAFYAKYNIKPDDLLLKHNDNLS